MNPNQINQIDNLKNDNTDIDINENRDNAIEINQYEEKNNDGYRENVEGESDP